MQVVVMETTQRRHDKYEKKLETLRD
jgi:hypothetical protein